MEHFKEPNPVHEAFWSPGGMYIVTRADIGQPGWVVRVLNFGSFKHREYAFATEAEARAYAAQWQL